MACGVFLSILCILCITYLTSNTASKQCLKFFYCILKYMSVRYTDEKSQSQMFSRIEPLLLLNLRSHMTGVRSVSYPYIYSTIFLYTKKTLYRNFRLIYQSASLRDLIDSVCIFYSVYSSDGFVYSVFADTALLYCG